jgi:cell division protein ZapA (FtsZ GTPase activity inhibitor)
MRNVSISQIIIVCIILTLLLTKDSEELKKWYKKIKKHIEENYRKKGI